LLSDWFPAGAVHGIDPASGVQQAKPSEPSVPLQEQGDRVSSTKKRKQYRSQLVPYMTRRSIAGSLPADDGDVERDFRKWYEERAKERRWEPLPGRRSVIGQAATIRPSLLAPASSKAPVKATDNNTQDLTTHKTK
jgi:hypothetical protein